jgi:hypothetical protein
MLEHEALSQAKLALRNQLRSGEISMGAATRCMRKMTGLNQKDYAKKILGITPPAYL